MSASELRRSRWLKLDPIVKWTTLRDCQRHAAKLLTASETWGKRCQSDTALVGQPLFSASVGASLAVCTASWLRVLQDVQDTYARKKHPFAETRRRGFRLEVLSYPTKHVERLVDFRTEGYYTLLGNDTASRFSCSSASVATVYADLPSRPTDREIWLGVLKAFTGIVSGLYIHERVVDFVTNSPLLSHAVQQLFPHLLDEKYLCIRTSDVSAETAVAASTAAAATSSGAGQPTAIVRAVQKSSHIVLHFDEDVFRNTWVVLPSAGRAKGQGQPTGARRPSLGRFSAGWLGDEVEEWSTRRVVQLAAYMVDNDASMIMVDEDWEFTDALQQALERHRTIGGILFGTPPAILRVKNVVEQFPQLLRSHMLSLIVPPSLSQNRALTTVVNTGLPGTRVVGLNCNALDALALYPHMPFTDQIGGCHKYLGWERTFVRRNFGSWAWGRGFDSGLPIKERIEVNPSNAKCGHSANLLWRERVISFWLQPYVVTAVPMLSARYIGL